jgi:hypothetical protein
VVIPLGTTYPQPPPHFPSPQHAERGAVATRRGRGCRQSSECCPTSHPFRDGGRLACRGRAGSRGSLLGEHFLGREAQENVPQAPVGLSEKQQPEAALEAARHLARQWSRPGEGLRARSAGAIAWFQSLRPKGRRYKCLVARLISRPCSERAGLAQKGSKTVHEDRITPRGAHALGRDEAAVLVKIAQNPNATLTEDERHSLRSTAFRLKTAARRAGVPIVSEGSSPRSSRRP